METRIDKDFGLLECDLFLQKNMQVKFFGKQTDCILIICTESDFEISQNQRSAYLAFISRIDDIVNRSEQGILKYCREWGIGMEVPDSELISCIGLKIVKVLFSDLDDPRGIGLVLDWSQDPELGIGVLIENEEIVDVSVQDIVLG